MSGAARAPWLGHLPTDRRGLPVPWINAWGDQDPSRASIVWDRHIPGWAIDTGEDRTGLTGIRIEVGGGP